MFRKLVSNLSFSPALITQVGFYAHRLRKEEATRRLTVIFVVLALIVQSLAVFSPPESATASSEQDIVHGGVENLDELLTHYDKNIDDVKDIYGTLGIDRSEIAATREGTINSKDANKTLYSLSRFAQYGPEQGETSFTYARSTGGNAVRFISPLVLSDTTSAKKRTGTNYDAFIGQSAKIGWFAVIKANASVVTKGYPPTITPSTSTATSNVVKTISATNLSTGSAVDKTPAKAFDKIAYSISLTNNGKNSIQMPIALNLSDSLEYATLVDDGGGTFNTDAKTLTWNQVLVGAGKTETRTFALQLFSSIPATPVGSSNGNSYDCIMSATYGSNIQVPVACPAVKGVENIVNDSPTTGIVINGIFSAILVAMVLFFYFRTRQMKKEIRLIRHTLNTGTI